MDIRNTPITLACKGISLLITVKTLFMKLKILSLSLFCILSMSKIQAQTGKILVEEHFVENDRGWNLGEDNNVVRTINDGKLVLECKKYLTGKGGGYWIKLPDFKLPHNNFSISLTTRWIKNMKDNDAYNPYGIILGDYYFLVYGDGERRLLKYNTVEKKYEPIVDWGVQSVIHKKGEADNVWEIRFHDGKAAFYANGQMLYKKEITLPTDCTVKLYIENSEMVAYDDLIVKELLD